MYDKFIEKLINEIFGYEEHSIYIVETEIIKSDFTKKMFQIIISPGKKYLAKILGKNGETINAISNLVKIKGYLNNHQIVVDIAK